MCPDTSIRLPRSLDTHNILHGDTGDHVTLHSGEILGGREFINIGLLLLYFKKSDEKINCKICTHIRYNILEFVVACYLVTCSVFIKHAARPPGQLSPPGPPQVHSDPQF